MVTMQDALKLARTVRCILRDRQDDEDLDALRIDAGEFLRAAGCNPDPETPEDED